MLPNGSDDTIDTRSEETHRDGETDPDGDLVLTRKADGQQEEWNVLTIGIKALRNIHTMCVYLLSLIQVTLISRNTLVITCTSFVLSVVYLLPKIRDFLMISGCQPIFVMIIFIHLYLLLFLAHFLATELKDVGKQVE